ncbi:Flavin-dependent oxidoreductase, luciferase family (includes alkanesulfonate monooxygenase SsuD and methylene tetrahydromethanopterin reductase) [Actinacidiphila alni]|uniref:Flavin-dependent oxidoreductase, luciferase family (Includes alkanesulfonate monooxygenase SsuD and methylene tetrahydromethanopterin reductase) n=1 Tax=Actinacidiphila alni TaxID=380248 RepID=A0A1I2MFX7_9ACTN|nr:LLM class flavin-dependent oxidoreductase [Actinacidiphila alni]SFF88061.1 Flavin-dependent oxidoreductase, luciferase family (includes alkanesulfonate monooxygenase SsuD and methylene tetrahydromethanopterin reductase) [Actinacidiphila alni]
MSAAFSPSSSSASSASPASPAASSGPPAAGIPLPPAPAVRRRTRTLHLAASIDGPDPYEAAAYVELARLAEGGALDFVTVDDCGPDCGPPEGPGPGGAGTRPGPLDILAAVVPATGRIGLVPTVTAGTAGAGGAADARRIAAAVGALDRAGGGRAGWTLRPAPGPAGPDEARWRAAEAVAVAVAREWGAAAGPGAPRNVPVTAVDATEPGARGLAARHADIAFVRAANPGRAGLIRDELRALATGAGRDPDRLLVLADLCVDLGGGELGPEPGVEITLAPDGAGRVLFGGGPVDLAELIAEWQQEGAVDGFRIRPVEPRRDLERFVNGTAALLQHRGLFRSFHPGATLREHLGLHRPPPRP